MAYNAQSCSSDLVCSSFCRDYSAPTGNLTSPYYPAPYPYDTDCVYTISQPNGTYIAITILTFDIDNEDSLEIRDGTLEGSILMGRFHGTNIPSYMQATQNRMWIK